MIQPLFDKLFNLVYILKTKDTAIITRGLFSDARNHSDAKGPSFVLPGGLWLPVFCRGPARVVYLDTDICVMTIQESAGICGEGFCDPVFYAFKNLCHFIVSDT